MRNLGSPKGVKAEVSAAQKDELSKILGLRAWRKIRTALMIKYSFRCCVCRQRKGASSLVVKHLSRPNSERRNELLGLRLLCLHCLD